MTGQAFPLVEVTRGPIVESVHYGSLAIAQLDGKIVFSAGDIGCPVFLRSASKPFQILAFLEAGGCDHYGLTTQEIAVMCASHSGTDEHVRVLEKLQAKIGITESMLQCGVHAPYHSATAREKAMKGEAFHSNQNDCSGKHSAMLAFAKMIGAPMDNYLDPAHPVQQAMLRTFAEMCRVPVDTVELGTDGCSAPVFAAPLAASAGAYARLCQPETLAAARAQACRLITGAMQDHPFMTGGPQRFDTDVMGAAGDRLGITIKISDGDLLLRAGCVAALAVLKELSIFIEDPVSALAEYDRRPVTTWRGTASGEIRPTRELLQALKQALA
jgi:L-asparaginase II